MSEDIFERISSKELLEFNDAYQPTFTQLTTYFPETQTSAEYIEVSDYDLDFNPPAELVGDNTVSPLAQRPTVYSNVQTLHTYKLKHELTDSQIRKLLRADSEMARREAVGMVFDDERRLINSQFIIREIVHAQLLYSGKYSIKSYNGDLIEEDYGLPQDNQKQINFETGDLLKEISELNNKLDNVLRVMIIQPKQMYQLMTNPELAKAVLTKDEAKIRTLTQDEVINAFRGFLGIEVRVLTDYRGGTYHYTDMTGKPIPFIPDDKIILLPNGPIGRTVLGDTAENLVLGAEYNKHTNNGITITSKYIDDPVNYYISSVSRFAVVHPHAERTAVLTHQGG